MAAPQVATSAEIHAPVLLAEVIAAIAPRDGGRYVDGTFGAGGYTRGLLDAAECRVWAIDRDPDAIARGAPLQDKYGDRLVLLHGRFGDMDHLLEQAGQDSVDGIALDLGVSSPQIDQAERGFSFREDGPLDMRMEKEGPSAADLVNTASEATLADIIYRLGEERHSRRIAKAIVSARTSGAILRTKQLADLVRGVVPPAKTPNPIDPATRTFQALRIHVNGELDELDRGLAAAERLLAPGGRLAVVSFHSLEDRVAKTFIRARSGAAARPSRHMAFADREAHAPSLADLSRKPIRPSDEECRRNPRARSARLRVAERTNAPCWSEEVTP